MGSVRVVVLAVVLDEDLPLFGDVASGATAFRVIERASDPQGLERLRGAHARAWARVWDLAGAPERLTIDLDATLIGSHSEKEGATGNFKGGYGFHPMLAYGDETDEALAGELRPGNAGANTAEDQITVAEHAIEQIPVRHIEGIKLLLRVDSAGASHKLLDWSREGRMRFSVGYELTDTVRTAILQIPDENWVSALDQDGSPRPNGQVSEITDALELTGWPEGSRVLVRRERARPGAQLSFTDHDGHRFQAILTDQPGEIAEIERRHRARARVEDHIRNDKDTGMRDLPFKDFEHNRVWLEIVRLAHDLIVWTQRLLLTGELASAEPKPAALPAPSRRRTPGLPRPHRDTAHPGQLALGHRPHQRVRAPWRAPRSTWLTSPPAQQHHATSRSQTPHEACLPTSARRPRKQPARSTSPHDGRNQHELSRSHRERAKTLTSTGFLKDRG